MKKMMKDQNELNEEVKTVKYEPFNEEMDRRAFLQKTTKFVGAAALGATLVNSIPSLLASAASSAASSSSIMKPKVTLNVISDIHLSDQRTSDKLSAALQDLYEIDPKVDAMVINGDLTNYGTEKEYSKLRELLEQSPKPEKTYMTIGNHEFFNRQGNEVNIKRFTDFIGENHVYYEKMVKGYSFIFLGSETWGPDGPLKDAANLSEEQLNWLEDTLEKRSKNKKPIFVFLHQQMEKTFDSPLPTLIIQNKELNDILSKYPQSILFSGHTHQDLHRPSIIQKDFTMINTTSVYYTTFGGNESQGLHLEVYDDKIIVKGRDFYRKQWIPEAQYTIDFQTKITSLTAPADIIGVAIGTAKTADALGLPTTVDLVTDSGSHPIQAKVTWNVDASNYDPTLKTVQTFPVNGTVTLPNGVENPNNVPLTTNIRITVNSIPQSQMTATATSQETSGENNAAAMAIDGDPYTIWHTKWDKSDVLPQSITLTLGGAYLIDKVTYLPRPSGSNGIITGYNVYVSADGVTFTKVASGTWANNNSKKLATFDPTDGSYVKLEATAGVNGFASAAEISVLVKQKL